ncbi:MAG: hypothetical protein HXX16_11340 [Bacteroidales bacterium]|nr:hypothetical protein [Bacteroidales bacterium]
MNYKNLIFILALLLLYSTGCKKDDEPTSKPIITLKSGGDYTQNGQSIAVGGKLKFGIMATNPRAIITDLKIQRIADGKLITEKDQGVYLKDSLNVDFNSTKSSATQEIWRFFVMNSNRDSSTTTLTINLGSGVDYGAIYHYPSLKIGMQSNTDLPNYLDLHTGLLYSKTNVSGHEGDIDLVGFVYTTSGVLSPTLCCPGYTGSSSVTGRYPEIASWSVTRLTSYDYHASDNNLVSASDFEHAQNDSLLVTSFKPESVSGLDKFCTTGKIVPFKTEDGKYGLVRVLHADLTETGYMELEVKIQK